jgi:serine/threonine protein kinase
MSVPLPSLEQGHYSNTKVALSKSGKPIVKKGYKIPSSPNKTSQNDRNDEVRIITDLLSKKCKHIIKLIPDSNTPNNANIATYLEFGAGKTLLTLITEKRKISPLVFYDYTFQLLQAIYCMHENNYIHHDIKPGNIVFLDEAHTNLAVIDFGLTQLKEDDTCGQQEGDDNYMAPEKLCALYTNPQATYACRASDLFSLGMTLAVVTPYVTFDTQKDNKNRNVIIPSPVYSTIINLINLLKKKKVAERWTWENVIAWSKDVARHPELSPFLSSLESFKDWIELIGSTGGYRRKTRKTGRHVRKIRSTKRR